MSAPVSRPGFGTTAIHAGSTPDPITGAVVTPISLATTFVQKSPGNHTVRKTRDTQRMRYDTTTKRREALFGDSMVMLVQLSIRESSAQYGFGAHLNESLAPFPIHSYVVCFRVTNILVLVIQRHHRHRYRLHPPLLHQSMSWPK